jgi:hypothetical protein
MRARIDHVHGCDLAEWLRIRIRDPVFFYPKSGIRIRDWKKSGFGMNNPHNISESLETIFWAKNT